MVVEFYNGSMDINLPLFLAECRKPQFGKLLKMCSDENKAEIVRFCREVIANEVNTLQMLQSKDYQKPIAEAYMGAMEIQKREGKNRKTLYEVKRCLTKWEQIEKDIKHCQNLIVKYKRYIKTIEG